MMDMGSLKAVVRGGRAEVQDRVDMPDGTELELEIVEDVLDDAEREALHRALDAARANARAGNTRPIDEVLRELDEL